MYPLSVTLVGCQDSVQRNVLSMLINQQATLAGQFPDVESAMKSLSDSIGSLRLFVVHLHDQADLAQLKLLSGSFVGQPILAIVDAQRNPALVIGAMRAGAAQVVPLPIMPDDFRSALDCIAKQFAHVAAFNQAIAVSGVTGGCGATTLAVNLAYELSSQQKQSVILTELALQIGKLAAYLDVNPNQTTLDLLGCGEDLGTLNVQKALARVADRFDVIVGEYRQISPAAVSTNDIVRLIDVCRSMANFAIYDVPCTYDDMYFEALAAADHVVLVGEQKIPAVRTLKLVCEEIDRMDGNKKLHIIINRYDPKLPGFGVDRLRTLLGKDTLHTIGNDYSAVMSSINHGRPLRQESPRSPALADMERVVRTLLEREMKTVAKQNGNGSPAIFGRLIKRIGLAN